MKKEAKEVIFQLVIYALAFFEALANRLGCDEAAHGAFQSVEELPRW